MAALGPAFWRDFLRPGGRGIRDWGLGIRNSRRTASAFSNPQSPIPIPCPFGILRPVQPPEDIMDMPSTPPRRSDRTFAWTAFNAVQFAFTLAWTAAWISPALLFHAVLPNRHWPLRLAPPFLAPGLLGGGGGT